MMRNVGVTVNPVGDNARRIFGIAATFFVCYVSSEQKNI